MRTFMRMTMVLALGVLVGAGCGKRAKLDLVGLEQNPAGSVDVQQKGEGIGVVEGNPEDLSLAPLATEGVNAGDKDVIGGDPLANIDPNAPAGGWQDTTAGLAGGANDSFVKDGKYWSEKVYFDFNRYEVRPSERAKLDGLAEHLRANPTFRVVIEGHCDDRGSDEYNRALSERRSLSVLTYLSNLGIDESRMHTVSYGEDRPAVQNAKTEADHQANRRAEFLVGLPK